MQATQAPAAENGRRGTILVYLALAAAIAVAQSGALFDEARHDDHLHRENLRRMGWSWNELVESTTFELPGRQLNLWWQQQPIVWRYPRPVAMAVLKAEFLLTGGDTFSLHVLGLAWHWLNCAFLFHLARWLLRSSGWAAVAALLFAIGPHTAVAVSWTAAHNVLVSHALLLGAVLLHLRAAFTSDAAPLNTRAAPLIGAMSLWAASLLAREATIIFPAIAMTLDLCVGGWAGLRRRWLTHGLLVLVAAAYVAWRFFVFPRGGMPTGYFHAPEGLAYVSWAASKYLQSIAVLIAQLPLYAPLDYIERWTPGLMGAQAVMLALLAAVVFIFARVARGEPRRWFGPLWVAMVMLPIVPIATSPHFAYTPAVGYAIATATFLSRLRGRWRVATVAATVLFSLSMFAFQRVLVRMQLRTEQLLIANVVESSPSPAPPEGSTIFFIDMPVSTTFSVIALRERWGLSELNGYALTTGYVHESRNPTRIERIGERTLELSCEPPGWFSQTFDRWLLNLAGRDGPMLPGTSAKGERFDATVLEGGAAGVTRIRFDFHDSLDRPDWLFFAARDSWPMQRVRFDGPTDAAADAAAAAEFQVRHAGWLAERDPLRALRQWLRPDAR